MKNFKRLLMKRMIAAADLSMLSEIVRAVIGRYDALDDREEIIFLSLPKNDPAQRRRIIESVLQYESKHLG